MYIDASHTAHVHFLSCILMHLIQHISFVCVCVYFKKNCCRICITFLNILSLIFFSLNIENGGECCKAQQVCVDQRMALYKSDLLLLAFRLRKIDPWLILSVCIHNTYYRIISGLHHHTGVSLAPQLLFTWWQLPLLPRGKYHISLLPGCLSDSKLELDLFK